VSVYLDASVLVPLFALDPFSQRAGVALSKLGDTVLVSDFAAAEYASVINRRVRARDLSPREGRQAFDAFDAWRLSWADAAEIAPQDIAACGLFLRRLDLPLKTPDGLHIAIASRYNAPILSFDRQLLSVAKKLGVPVAPA